MAGSSHHNEKDDRKDKEEEQSVLEPILEEAVEAIFDMLDTPPSFALYTLELLLQPIDAPGRCRCIGVVSPVLLP